MMSSSWKLERYSFNGSFWQRLAPLVLSSKEAALEAAKREAEFSIKCFLTEIPDGQASEPEGETK